MGNINVSPPSPPSPPGPAGSGAEDGTAPVYAGPGAWHPLLPLCLAEHSRREGLRIRPEALRALRELPRPVGVVGALPETRRGGVSVGAPTSRLWMCCLPHPHLPDHALVLLQPEAHLDKGDPEGSRWLLVLTLLLSSALIQSSQGDIRESDLERLRWLSELPELLRYGEGPEGGAALRDQHRFPLFFPTLLWVVWDRHGRDTPEDEHLEHLERVLRLWPGTTPEARRHNLPRECIRQFFPERRCLLLRGHLEQILEEVPEKVPEKVPEEVPAALRPREGKPRRSLWEEAPPKTLPGGLVVTGEVLARLAELFVEQIRAGSVPCVARALRDAAPAANEAAAAAAARRYREGMEGAETPAETVEELLRLQRRCEKEALELFMERAFPDGICNAQARFLRQVEELRTKFFSEHERLSRSRCQEALGNLSRDLEARLRDGSRGCLQALVEQYWEVPGKGFKAAAVLQEFLRSRTLTRSIPSADGALRTWRERYLRELEGRVREEEERRRQEQLRRRSEHQQQLRRKLEGFEARRCRESRRLVALLAKEERELRREGFHEQADELLSAITELGWELRGGDGGLKGWNGGWKGWNGGWNGGDGGWKGWNGGWNSNSSSTNSAAWIHVLLGVLTVLVLIILRI